MAKASRPLFVVLLFLSSFSSPLSAQTVSGFVLTAQGLPVVGATVRFNGPGLTATTLAAGDFSLVVPLGTHEVDINPGVTTWAPRRLSNVVVTGTQSLGNIPLSPGIVLTGTAFLSGGVPASQADINVYDWNSGEKLYTPNDNVTATGSYSVVVPQGTYRLRVSPATGQLFVAQEVGPLLVNAAQVVAPITLAPGFLLSATVVSAQSGLPVVGADVDVDNLLTNFRVPTPNDETNASGQFGVVVPAGSYRVMIEPVAGVALQGVSVEPVTVAAPTNLGTLQAQPGVILTGTVLGSTGAPVPLADLDITRTLGGVRLFTANDKTLSNGTFSIVVPPTNLEVVVTPPLGSTLIGERRTGLNIVTGTALPTFNLPQGVSVSGVVTTSAFGFFEASASVDFFHPTTGVRQVVLNNTTASNGTYQVLAAPGPFDVRIKTRKASLSRDTVLNSVPIGPGNTILNVHLPVVTTALFMDLVSPSTVMGGSFVTVTGAVFNPTAQVQSNLLELLLVDPAGVEAPLFPPAVGNWPPFFFQVIPTATVPIPVPNPAHSGLPFRLRVRFRNATTNAVIDQDEVTIVIL